MRWTLLVLFACGCASKSRFEHACRSLRRGIPMEQVRNTMNRVSSGHEFIGEADFWWQKRWLAWRKDVCEVASAGRSYEQLRMTEVDYREESLSN